MADTFRNAEAEIKIILAGGTAEDARRSLGLEPGNGKRLGIHFWDAPREDGEGIRLPLAEAGAIIRLRRPDRGTKGNKGGGKGDRSDLTAKLRPCDPAALPAKWRENRGGKGWEFKVEEDWSGSDRVWSASLKVDGTFEPPASGDGNGPAPWPPPLTPGQRDLLAHAGITDDGLRDAVALGPVRAARWKLSRPDLARPLTAEFWSVGDDGPCFLELSLRAPHADAPGAQELLERIVREQGLRPAPQQASKTQTVMTELARNHLRGAG
ncbi:hypothetical protein EKH77_02960 [Streptomyces luteoverticillatus]|uniref:CYTH domain-containing protein n=1 Tax=Streptomyces luteoverticillatus TaxID=66425 RepID=A0A3S9PD99_STRLT|nr:hypothetical protein [Streptomyces luteoverticillatus]AZQ70314.1 hypothetical protein EKH77_02960 [Streptomyces luteoverticillatus]